MAPLPDRSDETLTSASPAAGPGAVGTGGGPPYLSVVVTARNDDHGGNLLRRMQTFVNALIAQAKRHAVSIELVVVDWNPPLGKPALCDVLNWPSDPTPVDIRFIEVPNDLHRQYKHAEALPLYQMIAKNVGIRRARGRFVLATNIDIVFSDELFEFLAAQRLKHDKMYRIDRHDVEQDVPTDDPVDMQIDYCKSHLIRVNTRNGTFRVRSNGERLIDPEDIFPVEDGIAFGEGWYPLEGTSDQRFRWVRNDAEIFITAQPERARQLVVEVEPGPGVGFMPFHLQVLDSAGEAIHEAGVFRRQKLVVTVPPSPGRRCLRLRALAGGLETDYDPRILNFRVFHCSWHAEPAQQGRFEAGQAPSESETRGAGTSASETRGGDGGESGAAQRTPVDHSSLPRTSPTPKTFFQLGPIAQRLKTGIAVAWSVHGLSVLRRLQRFVGYRYSGWAPPEILPEDLQLLWGRGWYALEFYKGESFRWARQISEIIVHTPREEAVGLRLQVEPGPALGFGPFHLRVRDEQGKTVATAVVHRRQWIELPLPWRPGRTRVFTLEALGQRPPRILRKDRRSLHFRILRGEWGYPNTAGVATETAPSRTAPMPWLPVAYQPGLLLGGGWKAEPGPTPASVSWLAGNDAEIIVHGRQASANRGLALEVEPRSRNATVVMTIREGRRILEARTIRDTIKLRIEPFWKDGQTAVIRLETSELDSRGLARSSQGLRVTRLEHGEAGIQQAPGSGVSPAGANEQSGGQDATVADLRERQTTADQELAGAGGPLAPPTSRSAVVDGGTDARGTPEPEPATAGPAPNQAAVGALHLHTNACGDFTLLARERWFELRGYPEFDLFSMNIDSVFCYAAHHAGALEEMLPEPMRIYHIEHATGSGFTPEGEAKLFKRIAAKGMGWIDYQQVLDWAAQMRRYDAPIIFNRENWGLAGIELRERWIGSKVHSGTASGSPSPG